MTKGKVSIWLIMILVGWSSLVYGLSKEEKAAVRAIENGDIENLKLFLEKHPGPDCKFSDGKSGIYYAIIYGKINVTEFLLKKGANPDLVIDGHALLNWAVIYSRGRIVRLLIEYGADINQPDDKGKTPLMHAAELDNLQMCRILINRGANPLLTTPKGKKASDYATYSGADEYLLFMEGMFRKQDSIPKMHDGPYMYFEDGGQLSVSYLEHDPGMQLTRIIERTIDVPSGKDIIVQGFGWDTLSYIIRQDYTPLPYKVETSGDIFAIGDIHGRYKALVRLLENNGIINDKLEWTFGKGQLVLLGDLFDRGPYVTEVLWFLYNLEFKAEKAGGGVQLLLGNHEIMAMTGDHRYLNYKYRYFSEYTQTYYYQLLNTNSVLGKWLRSKNIVVRVNDNLFMHAGISPQFVIYEYSFDFINSTVQKYLSSDYSMESGSPENIILGPIGPQWYRGYQAGGSKAPELTQDFLDLYLDPKGIARMVLGHNEQTTITASFNGRVISADVEINQSGESAEGLLISGEDLFVCHADGSRTKLAVSP